MSMAAVAVISAVMVGTSIYSGEQQRKASRRSLLAQEKAQAKAQRAEIGTKRLADQEKRRANQKRSGVDQYLAQASAAASSGPASTLMTGGMDRSLLGGRSTLI